MTKRRLRHLIIGYLLTLIISWIVWCLVDIDNYLVLSGRELWNTLWLDFTENVIESLCLYCFSVISCKILLHHLWKNKNRELVMVAFIALHVSLNACFALGMTAVYKLILPFEKNIFIHILLSDYFVVEILSTTYLSCYLIAKLRKEERAKLISQAESKEKEISVLHTKLDMLSLQTNNHFIFNSFSTAAGLVRHDPEAAETFIKRLSSMYRFMTQNCQSHLIPLADELEFVDNYINMLEIRYSGIYVSISPDLRSIQSFVPPASIQALMENAVKHNGHGPGCKLTVEVTLEGESIVVTNNIVKLADEIAGTHSGLENLKRRYSLLTEKKMLIENDGQTFKVTIPLIFEEV